MDHFGVCRENTHIKVKDNETISFSYVQLDMFSLVQIGQNMQISGPFSLVFKFSENVVIDF